MKAILKENQNEFSIKLGPEETAKSGLKYKKLYLFGNSFELNKDLKSLGGGLGKDFGAKWDKNAKKWFFLIFKDKNTDEYNTQDVTDKKVKPYINKVNEFYKYTLDLDTLIDQLEDYTPAEQSTDKNAAQVATKEEATDIKRRLELFKDELLNISSSEELQNTMKLMMDVKAGKTKFDFSPNNKIAIKAQRPDATVVCNKNNWMKWFNRTIKPDAKPIFVNSASSGGYNKNITNDFLSKVGSSTYGNLSGTQKQQLHNLQTKSKYGQATSYAWVAFYDVKDTIQIEGTYDEIGADIERAEKAAAELGNTQLDGDTQTTTDNQIIKPVHDGLLAYANAQNVGITADKNVNAASTKLLASALLSQILSGKISGIASKAAAEAKTETARRQQAEVASWQFMDAFDVKYNLADVDMNMIFGAPEAGKDYQTQKDNQKKQINNVLKDISSAVNHLIDFVNINIKDNAKLNEIEGGIPQGKHVTPNDIANTLGVSDMINEQALYERLRKRINLI